ncbi:MAG: hypothetical protein KDB23_34030, partial [Planctomycetales bacterium]|nr:hypothetical protein [Planctomycetales bacterium]
VEYTAGEKYTVTLEAGTNTFVSQRVHGILWEYAPVSTERGDFNNDGLVDHEDIDSLTFAIREGLNKPLFDLNSDGDLDGTDRAVWVNEVRRTFFGDANLDGEFNSADFVLVFQAGEYEDGVPMNSVWRTGDWNGDGDFDSSDFVTAFQSGGFEQGPRASTSAVPEPASFALTAILVCATSVVLRRPTRSPASFA